MNGHLRINDRLRAVGSETARWQVIDPTPRSGCIKVFDAEKHKEEYKPFRDISAKIVSGELILVRDNAPRLSVAAQKDPKLQQTLADAMRHLHDVNEIRRKYQVSVAAAYQTAKAAHEQARKAAQERRAAGKLEAAEIVDEASAFPSRATIYRYFEANRNGLPLLRGDANKGNRTPRYEESVVTLICDQAQALYLQPNSRFTLGKLIERVNDALGEETGAQKKYRVGTEFVKRTIYERLSVDPEKDRMDPKDVPSGKSVASHRIVVSAPFERVEQDAVHLPFVVLTEHGPTSNVWLVHSIDCFSGVPLGWHIVVGAPRESDGMKCVEATLYSKAAAFKRLGYKCELDVYGTPHQLIFDNGPETKGERMSRLTGLAIDPMHCKSRHAHGKPFIERINLSLKRALETLPGCTRFNDKDGQRDPIKAGDELITLEALERWLVRWYFDVWVKTPLERHERADFIAREKLGSTPAARMRSMEELCYAMPLSPPLAEWHMTLYEHEVRTLSRKTGITYEGFHYRGQNLRYLIDRYGEVQLRVFVDPDDYRQVYVDDGPGMPLVPLIEEFADPTTPAHSYAYMKEGLKQTKRDRVEDPTVIAFRRDMQRESAQPPRKSGAGKPRKSEQNRAIATAVKADKAIQRAIDRPLGVAPGPATTVAPSAAAFSFDDAEALPVLSRASGKKQS